MDLRDERTRELFLELVELHSWEDRLSRLEATCGDDAELRDRVVALLRTYETGRSVLAGVCGHDGVPPQGSGRVSAGAPSCPEDVAADSLPSIGMTALADRDGQPTPHPPGSGDAPSPGDREDNAEAAAGSSFEEHLYHIGRYALREPIGRDGMGCVYRAYDETLNREVAIKVVDRPQGGDTPESRRFLVEALITAQLQHPGIPAVHGLGIDARGRPFLAMKLVAGDTLAALLRQRTDTGEARGRFMAIFEQVCHAVGYAHDHGVIHRDLKPSNVMVGEHGEVQVMDWGLAKVLSGPTTDASEFAVLEPHLDQQELESAETVSLPSDVPFETPSAPDSATRTGSVLGTPRYMSPEQAGGEVRKLDPRCDVFGLGAILCEILTGKPPYTGSDPHEVLLKAVRGELQDAFARLDACGAESELIALCKRCLSFDRNDRPANGRAVAEEIGRIRQKAEERARAAELERARASVREAEQRKRRRILMTALAALLAVLSAGVVGTSLGLIRAEKAARSARDAQLRAEAERDAKARALQAEREAREKEKAARERVLAALRLMTDDLVENVMANRWTLKSQNKRFLRSVLKHYEAYSDLASDDLEGRALRAEGLQRVALVHKHLGDLQEAEQSYRAAVELWQALSEQTPENSRYRENLARSLKGLASVLRNLDRFEEAEPVVQRALQIARDLAEQRADDASMKDLVAMIRCELGMLWRARGRKTQAEEQLRQAVATWEQLAARDPSNVRYVRMIAGQSCNLGNIIGDQGRLDEAAECFRKSIDLYTSLLERFPGDVDTRHNLSTAQHNLALVYRRQDRYKDAIAAYRRALALRRRVANQVPGRPSARHSLADTLLGLGLSHLMVKQFDEALACFQEADEHNRAALKMSPRHPEYRAARRTCLVYTIYTHAYRSRQQEALQTAQTLCDLGYDPAEDAWRAARTLAYCVSIARSLDELPPQRQEQVAASYAEHALAMLRSAIAAGFRDVQRLEKDSKFDPLRSHPQFQQMLAELKAAAP